MTGAVEIFMDLRRIWALEDERREWTLARRADGRCGAQDTEPLGASSVFGLLGMELGGNEVEAALWGKSLGS